MRYVSVFITMCIIIIIICGVGIGYMIYQQNPERHYRKGVASYESGNYEAAIESLNEYLSFGFANEQTEKARYYLAAAVDRKRVASYGSGAAEAMAPASESDQLAKSRYLAVINKNNRGSYYVEAVVGYAEICRRNGEYDRFILHKLEDVIHAQPDSKLEDDIFMLIGYQYLFAGSYEQAMNAFLHSSHQLAKLGQARTHVKLGQYESAFKIYDDFLQFFPSSPYISRVGEAYRKQGLYYAGLLKKNGKCLEAIPVYVTIAKHFTQSEEAEEARYRSGECYYELENYNQAITWFKETVEDTTHALDDSAVYHIGLCYYELGNYIDSYKYFNLVINQYPNSIYVTRSQQWVRQLKKDLEYFQQ